MSPLAKKGTLVAIDLMINSFDTNNVINNQLCSKYNTGITLGVCYPGLKEISSGKALS
jgi:hypothetical protein